jgi:dolichol-phosphate mannosyltransferase
VKSLIAIPTYNERGNLENFVKKVLEHAPHVHMLIIDDNSPDGTGEIADMLHHQYPQISVIHRPGKLGLGTAYVRGFHFAIENGYDYIFEMDADFSHDPQDLPRFLRIIETSSPPDLIIGSRYIPGGSTPNWSRLRKFISGGGNRFARLILRIPIHDCTSGYRCYNIRALAHLYFDSIRTQGYAFQVEMAYSFWKSGFNIIELPITFIDRQVGKSKMSRKIFIEAFSWVMRTWLKGSPVVHKITTSALGSYMVEDPTNLEQIIQEKTLGRMTAIDASKISNN